MFCRYVLIIIAFLGIKPCFANPNDEYTYNLEVGRQRVFIDFSSYIYSDFENAANNEEKFKIITSLINVVDYLIQKGKTFNFGCFRPRDIYDYYTTRPIFLEICFGRSFVVKKYLSVIEDVNDPNLTVWGFKQPYSLAHIALDPQYPFFLEGAKIKERIKIIDLLGKKGADFNVRKYEAYHNFQILFGDENPPLTAGRPSGKYPHYACYDNLRARAILYGADPLLDGTSYLHDSYMVEDKKFQSLLLDYYIELQTKGKKIIIVDVVKENLKKEIERREKKSHLSVCAAEILNSAKQSLELSKI